MSSADGATLVAVNNAVNTSDPSNDRFYFSISDNATVSDQMTLIMIARKSPSASAGSIPMRIGGYDNLANLTISSSDWKLYRVPLNNSSSPNCSIYIDQQGPTIEYKYFAIVGVDGVITETNLLPDYTATGRWFANTLVKDSEGVNELQLVPSINKQHQTYVAPFNVNATNTYTWTFWARADNAGDTIHTELWGGGGVADISLTTNWKKYQSQGNFKSSYQWLYFWGNSSNKGNVYVKLPCLYNN